MTVFRDITFLAAGPASEPQSFGEKWLQVPDTSAIARKLYARCRMATAVLFPVSVEHKMGYIDAKGRVRIPPRFDFANLFSG